MWKKKKFINGYKGVENKNTELVYTLQKNQRFIQIRISCYSMIAVFLSLLAYISPFTFLYHFLGNQANFSTQLMRISSHVQEVSS